MMTTTSMDDDIAQTAGMRSGLPGCDGGGDGGVQGRDGGGNLESNGGGANAAFPNISDSGSNADGDGSPMERRCCRAA
eukprot:9861030-Lingulodinium_polyedra.AAC.1